jgi:hypothetical protein
MVYFYVIYGLLLEIVVIQSIETITIRVTIQNVLTNIETQYILEIQLRVIRDSETSRIKSHYTFRPAHRPPIARSSPADCPHDNRPSGTQCPPLSKSPTSVSSGGICIITYIH